MTQYESSDTCDRDVQSLQQCSSADIFTEIFNKQNPNYQLCYILHFSVPPVRSVHDGTESLSLLGPKIWDIVPTELKEVKMLSAFKSEIKEWWLQNSPCRLCK